MASIFTYDPDPPRVASPWLKAAEADVPADAPSDDAGELRVAALSLREGAQTGKKITRLHAEPQEGPVEYKLHLLLRPRRKFRSTSTGTHISGSKHSMFDGYQSNQSLLSETTDQATLTAQSGITQQTRQHRLQQLTTQLLWRLQQSSPHHTSSATNTILPSLPEALPELQAPQQPAKLLHGLEESQGALYEIGVTDDGTLVGLAEDEMLESLNNLRAMAACLGCTVEVLRKETVGECEWFEDGVLPKIRSRKSGKLVVAEALVKPFLQVSGQPVSGAEHSTLTALPSAADLAPPNTEQLRITLTGPTGCGKSTLLGSLVTSTLDNGRGKSRLSMLKHRHEITSGITSSVTQELVGYQDAGEGGLQVINYATENVASWIDIHVAAAGDRMVFISDSAGHPRYRRTTLRGLVGWAPHWTLLCIPADDTESAGGQAGTDDTAPSTSVHDMDLSGAQLDLCLRLGLPLVIVITKLDVASLSGLRGTLTKVLDVLKAAGKKPAILPNKPGAVADEKELQSVGRDTIAAAFNAAVPLLNDPRSTVPIVLTSAFNGTGIANLHALLHELPLPDTEEPSSSAQTIFDVEDIYNKPAEVSGVILSGHLRAGSISVGDEAFIGPFSALDSNEDSEDSDDRSLRRNRAPISTSRSFPGALRDSHLSPPFFHLSNQEWRKVKVSSIRNLRLPVHDLQNDQVGTLAVTATDEDSTRSPPALGRIRKGMVLTKTQPLATRSFTAKFKREDLESLAVGNHVVVYISSVRASARVVSARAPDSPTVEREEAFAFEDEEKAGQVTAMELLVTFSFVASKEFVIEGGQVLVMPGGGPGLFGGNTERGEKGIAGLEGFVGVVVEVRG